MPAGLSVTKEQFERDLVRTDRELREAEDQIKTLMAKVESLKHDREIIKGALEMYFRAASEAARLPAGATLDHLSIADSCEEVFKELENRWLSLADLDTELRRHGKVCSKGSIEIMLKGSGSFEVERRGKKNFYRMREK